MQIPPDVEADPAAKKYFVSTAIAYTNGHGHVGHMYEFLSADVIARFHRVFGHKTYFLTGTDEHGQKVILYVNYVHKINVKLRGLLSFLFYPCHIMSLYFIYFILFY